MGYELFVEHPESSDRRRDDFASWSMWAPQHAPWTGVGISEMAHLLQDVCGIQELAEACSALDQGGIISTEDARVILDLSHSYMNVKVRGVFRHAVRYSYPIRVVFSKGFGSLSASAYLAKQSST